MDYYYPRVFLGHTPLHLAVLKEEVETFNHLLTLQDTPLDPQDAKKQTPLHLAGGSPNTHFALTLIDRGADVNIPRDDGRTPLHIAISAHHHSCEIVKKLIIAGSNLDAVDIHGFTPLMNACQSDCHECIYMLLCSNADVSPANCFGNTAFAIALPLYYNIDRNRDLCQILFNYTFDDFNRTCNLNLLAAVLNSVRVTRGKSFFLLAAITDHVSEVTCDESGLKQLNSVFFLYWKYVDAIVAKYPNVIRRIASYNPQVFFRAFNSYFFHDASRGRKLFYYKLASVLGVDLPGIFHLIASHFESHRCLEACGDNLGKMVWHMASLGCSLSYQDLVKIHGTRGACAHFPQLLHLLENSTVVTPSSVSLMVDIHFTVETRLFDHNFSAMFHESLLKFFAGQRLKDLLLRHNRRFSCSDVPSLLELSRNSFRRYLIDRFHVRNIGMFLAYVNHLEINDVFKDIICYRKEVYCIDSNV